MLLPFAPGLLSTFSVSAKLLQLGLSGHVPCLLLLSAQPLGAVLALRLSGVLYRTFVVLSPALSVSRCHSEY
jgi:hypothetical protein